MKLISLEGVDGHVFRSVAENHHRIKNRPAKTNDDSHRATERKGSFVDEFINGKRCASRAERKSSPNRRGAHDDIN